MAQVLVRGLPEEVVDRLKARARAHGRSLEAELRAVLQEAANMTRAEFVSLADSIAARSAEQGQTDSVVLLREDRDR